MATDPSVSPADTIRGALRWIQDPFGTAPNRERQRATVALDALLALIVQERQWIAASQSVGAERERDRQQIARLTAAYCDPKMWRETWLDNGASVWEFLCAADCDEPWNPIAVLAGEEDARP